MAATLAVLLRAWRQRALRTQEELSDLAGVSVRTIRRLERGQLRRPRSHSLRSLARGLGLTEAQQALLFEAAQAVAAAPVRQLPIDFTAFAGRSEHLEVMDGLLERANAAVIVVTGTAGVGKTTLAVHWAHRVADHFPDGQLYLDLHGYHPSRPPMDSAEVTRILLETLGIPPGQVPAEPQAQHSLLRGVLSGRRMLLVFDNARDSDKVRPLLPGDAGCPAVVTSRDRLGGIVAPARRPSGGARRPR